jgi:hypothetical protein
MMTNKYPIPGMELDEYQSTKAFAIARDHSVNDVLLNQNTRIVQLMYQACISVRNSPSVTHEEKIPGDRSTIRHRFDWDQEIKDNTEFHTSMFFAKKIIKNKNKPLNPVIKQQIEMHKYGTLELSLIELTGYIQDSYPDIAGSFNNMLTKRQRNTTFNPYKNFKKSGKELITKKNKDISSNRCDLKIK